MERSPAKKVRQVREKVEEDLEGMDMFKYLGLTDQKLSKTKAESSLALEPIATTGGHSST